MIQVKGEVRFRGNVCLMTRVVHLPLLLILFLLGACSKPAENAQPTTTQPTQETYTVRGILRGINFADQSVTVEHEEVPDYMPAMTMPFDVKSMAEVQPLKVGDGMEFRLVVTDKDSWIEDVKKIDPNLVKLPPKRSAIAANSSNVERLKEGDQLIDFKLVDQKGQQITRETFSGKPLFITFIFTRCPIPNFCPLMSENFVEIQKGLAGSPKKDDVQYLSISFDPEFDTPEILSQYAQKYSADGEQWRFATGTPEEIKKLTQAFSVYVQPEQGTISHGLATALVGPDGTIRKIFRGNSWQAEEAVQAVQAL